MISYSLNGEFDPLCRQKRTKFLLLGNRRSGTTLLRNLLASHRNIVSYAELLNPGPIIWGNGYKILCDARSAHKLRADDPLGFLDLVYNMPYESWKTVVGFKALYSHFEEPAIGEALLSYLSSIDDFKTVHIKRQNVLKSYVSGLLADERFCQGKMINAYRAEDVERDITLAIDKGDFITYYNKTKKLEERYDAYFNGRSITVYYEDLIQNSYPEVKRILDYLGVRWQTVSSPTYKVRQKPISEVILNYEELKEDLRGTGCEQFFGA